MFRETAQAEFLFLRIHGLGNAVAVENQPRAFLELKFGF